MSLDDMLFGSKVVRSIEALPSLTIGLLPHQERAARFALSRSGSYLALDMGLGKTATAISVIAAAKSFGDSPALVVAHHPCWKHGERNWLSLHRSFPSPSFAV